MKPLFSITSKDLRVDTFRSGGSGGQNQNKRDTGVRITHLPSGAVGEARDQRQQAQNKKLAMERLVASDTFQKWVRVQASAIMEGFASLERKVDSLMKEEHIRTELTNECIRGETICQGLQKSK